MSRANDIFSKYSVAILITLFLILISIAAYKLYEIYFGYYITAKFSQSGPLYLNMPVYYKGYNIGRTTKIKPDKDYKYTYATIMLYPQDPKLPKNIVAKVKNHNVRKEYVDLMVQDAPSTTLIKRGSIIEGIPAFDLEAFLAEIADSGIIVPLLQNFSDTLVSVNKASTEMGKFFSDSRLILKDNRQNLKQATTDIAKSTKDIAQSSKSFKKITSRVNNSLTEDKLNGTTSSVSKASANILSATENIKTITTSIDCATRNLGTTIAKIDSAVSDTNVITSNVRIITGGLCQVLHQRFAGLRIIFGKPLNNCNRPRNCFR